MPVDARVMPTCGLLPPDTTCHPCVETPAVVLVPSHGPMPLDASADTAAVILAPAHETRHSDTQPTVYQPHSPPKCSAEEEVDSVHKRLCNNSGTATVHPTREDTPIHQSIHLRTSMDLVTTHPLHGMGHMHTTMDHLGTLVARTTIQAIPHLPTGVSPLDTPTTQSICHAPNTHTTIKILTVKTLTMVMAHTP